MDWLIVAAVLFYLIFSFVVARKFNEDNQQMLFALIVMVFMPILGHLMLIILKRKKYIDKENNLEYIVHGDLDSRQNMLFLNPINKQDELNKIPMEEALNLNNYKTRRKFIMDTMQDDDVLEYLWCLKQALGNEDVETVHYASAVIMETQRKISDSVTVMNIKYQKNPESKENIENYEDILEKIIFSGVYDDINLHRYYEEYKKLSDNILQYDYVEEKYLLNRARIDFKIGDYVHAKHICERYRNMYPDSENMIISNIKYYVKTYDKENLNQFLKSIEGKKDNLTYNSLRYIEFFTDH